MADGSRPPGSPAEGERTTTATGAGPTMILGGKYRIEREVGEGAFGRVYLALDPMLRRSVAIKELLASRNKADAATYGRYLERFQREARAAGGLTHPNIVTVYELAVDPDANYYLVMEYVDGTDLRDLLDQVGSLPVERAVALTIAVASALDVIHDADIVHRDLKPANIMLTRRGIAKVTDFGIAQVGNESHRTQVAVGHPGTPMYMSPEQARGYGYIDGRSDLYSLGLILYEMLAGEPYARRRIPLGEKRPDLPSKLIAIVERLMAEDPRDRYQSAEALLADLQQLSAAPAAPALPIADAPTVLEDGKTRVGAPPWGTGPAAPTLGVPSAYGGAASQNPPGAPVAHPPIAAPTVMDTPTRIGAADGEERTRVEQPSVPAPFTGAASAIGGMPPVTSGGAYTPIASPPSRPPATGNRRGLWIGLGGALVALLIVGGIVGLLAGRGGNQTGATDTPRPVAQATLIIQATGTPAAVAANAPAPTSTPEVAPTATSAPVATPTATAFVAQYVATPTGFPTYTPVPPPTLVPTRRPTLPAAPLTNTWADPQGHLTLRYPATWKVENQSIYALSLRGPDGSVLSIRISNPPRQPTLDAAFQAEVSQIKANFPNAVITPVQDVTVGGKPAKYESETYGDNFRGEDWVVFSGGTEYDFSVGKLDVNAGDIEQIIASVKFP